MGNGPSLADTMRQCRPALEANALMAVNFAANADEFYQLRPQYYVLADPHFFTAGNENVMRLQKNLATRVDWDITLFLPARGCAASFVTGNPHISVRTFNAVGVEGFEWLENMAFSSGRGMPRPRNVLIPAIMIGIWLGYRDIYLAGADHSWMRTLEVNELNEVISVQPHFYREDEREQKRVASVYRNVRLHEVIHSFYVAFKSYFTIRRYADRRGVRIYNSTPGSFIDAFPRRPLPQ